MSVNCFFKGHTYERLYIGPDFIDIFCPRCGDFRTIHKAIIKKLSN